MYGCSLPHGNPQFLRSYDVKELSGPAVSVWQCVLGSVSTAGSRTPRKI